MVYRNGTYVAFDGNGTTDPTQGDLKYYALLKSWNNSSNHQLNFSDSHLKTYQVMDNSSKQTLQKRLLERMKNSKNMLLIISDDTNYDRGLLNFEIEKAVDYYKIPLIIAYTGYGAIWGVDDELENKWPKALKERISEGSAKCIHIPFKEKAIMCAISQFSVHSTGNNILTGSKQCYTKETYINWGYTKK